MPLGRYDRRFPDKPQSRGLSRREAAAFAGLSLSSFDAARKGGKYPGPTLAGGRYDRALLEAAMDKASGIANEDDVTNPLDAWRAAHAR